MKHLSIYRLSSKTDETNKFENNADAIDLGWSIFFDTRFSANNKVSCATCHQPDLYFTDGLTTAEGLGITRRNTPTVVGASHNTWHFWDGRSDSLWSQALGPLENELEHGGNRGQYANIVFNDDLLRSKYEKVFGPIPDLSDETRFPASAGPVKDAHALSAWKNMSEQDQNTITAIFVNIGKSIAAYETRLQPEPSRFDYYVQATLSGNIKKMHSTLSEDEVAGLKIFIGKGNCTICHNGPMFTDSSFHNIATPAPAGETFDWGRYNGAKLVLNSPFNCASSYNDSTEKSCVDLKYIVTDKHETLGSVKTPGLRNVSKTAPYMHAGQYKSLKEVIKHYVDPPALTYRQSDLLDIDLTEIEINQLEAFLKTLNSEINSPPELLRAPG